MSSQSSSQSDSAPQDEYIPRRKKAGSGGVQNRKQREWVCVMPESFCGLETADDVTCSMVSLRDPNTSKSIGYVEKVGMGGKLGEEREGLNKGTWKHEIVYPIII